MLRKILGSMWACERGLSARGVPVLEMWRHWRKCMMMRA
jgi:hypothetical protein